MLGVIFNTFTVTLGSLIGLFLKNGIKERYKNVIMSAIGLCNIAIGVLGIINGKNTLVLIFSMLFGVIIGTFLDIDKRISAIGDFFASKLKSRSQGSVTAGFVNASLLFCVGSMTIVGSVQAGISGDNSMIFAKSVLDLFSSAILASTLGFGVLLASIFVFGFQGLLVLMSSFLSPYLTSSVIAEISCAGGIMILAIGLNLLNITKIKTANLLPALIFIPIFASLFNFFM